jgi:diguanylate cyclase (GGDEF)-like protein/PAS domain S-box-containing protein
MQPSLLNWLSAPTFADDAEKNRRAQFVYALNIVGALCGGLLLIANALQANLRAGNAFMSALMIGTAGIIHFLLRKGHVRLTAFLLTTIVFWLSTLGILLARSIQTPASAAYIIAVILSASLLGRKGAIVSILASLLAIFGFMAAQITGIMTPGIETANTTYGIILGGVFTSGGIIAYYLSESANRSLKTLQAELIQRKEIETTLKKLNIAVEQSPVSVVITDLQGNIEYVNRQFSAITGYTPEEAVGKNPRILHSGLTPPETHTDLWATLAAGYEWRGEFVNRKKDGSIYYEHATIRPVTNEEGVPTNYLAVKEDITERKQNENALIESNARFRSLFNQNHDGVFIIGLDGRSIDANQRAADMLGYTREELRSGKDREALADPQTKSENSFTRVLAGEQIPLFERTFRRKNGETFPVEINLELVRDENGKPLHVQSIARDISARKQAEKDLRESEKRYRSLFNQTHDAVFMLDFEGRHLAANQRAAEMMGYTPEEMKNLSVNETSGEREKSREVMKRILAGEKIPLYERIFRKKDGALFPVEINLELVCDSEGNPLHIQSVVRDISQRKAQEEALRIANEELQQRIRDVEKLRDELREQALHDPLTGLYNRRYLNEALHREVLRSKRNQQPLSIIAMDIDHFKKVNDTYGHKMGDIFLQEVARVIKNHARGYDFVCRYGGEEFLLVLPGAEQNIATSRAEQIRGHCANIAIPHEGRDLHVTISMGVATYPADDHDIERVIIKADMALYYSKKNGRNQVTMWREGMTME